jgi:hypothetical protein
MSIRHSYDAREQNSPDIAGIKSIRFGFQQCMLSHFPASFAHRSANPVGNPPAHLSNDNRQWQHGNSEEVGLVDPYTHSRYMLQTRRGSNYTIEQHYLSTIAKDVNLVQPTTPR